jgi:UDP-3-O-[3-hydroxymyristoyl] N-acetylglucosamine deacetylase/3-hydroxyacyl-[acyl-carrier-protein] dehydratase
MIQGGTLQNAVVVKPDGILNQEPLRFEDEFVRHKILDFLATSRCSDARREGTFSRSNRGTRRTFASCSASRPWRNRSWARLDQRERRPVQLDINAIQRIMPHRYPFLLVDRILSLEPRRVVGIKNVTINEPFFNGHFPGHPIMPAVLIIEAMAQCGGVLLLNSVDRPKERLVYFMGIDNAKFRKPVRPGDQLRFELTLLRLKSRICKMEGKAYVDGDLVAEAELLSSIVDRNP